jgi:hypothetical protein
MQATWRTSGKRTVEDVVHANGLSEKGHHGPASLACCRRLDEGIACRDEVDRAPSRGAGGPDEGQKSQHAQGEG